MFDATVGIKINAQNRVDLMVKNLLDENYAEKPATTCRAAGTA